MDTHKPERSIICIDMKCFYASCIAMLEDIDVMQVPIAVIANFEQSGSVVLAASPPLKEQYKIKTGSRKYQIPNDPRIRLFKPQMSFFIDLSIEIAKLIAEFVPKSSMFIYSIDEIFVDLTDTKKLWGTPKKTALAIQQAIYDQFRILSAVGLGPNMLLAKLALDLDAKKTGFTEWTYDDVKTKLWPVTPLSKIWGIGKNLEQRLNLLGIHTVGDLAHADVLLLEKKFGVIGQQLHAHAWGIDYSNLSEPFMSKNISFSQGQVLLRDYYNKEAVKTVILEMCEDVAKRLRDQNFVARTISLSLSYSKKTATKGFYRSTTLPVATSDTMDIYEACCQLFNRYYDAFPTRKLTIAVSNIERNTSVQLDLFDNSRLKRFTLAKTVDQLRDQLGPNSILRAVSYTDAGTARKRSELIGGHLA